MSKSKIDANQVYSAAAALISNNADKFISAAQDKDFALAEANFPNARGQDVTLGLTVYKHEKIIEQGIVVQVNGEIVYDAKAHSYTPNDRIEVSDRYADTRLKPSSVLFLLKQANETNLTPAINIGRQGWANYDEIRQMAGGTRTVLDDLVVAIESHK